MNIVFGVGIDLLANVTRYRKKPRKPAKGFTKKTAKGLEGSMHSYLPNTCILIYRNLAFLLAEISHYYLPFTIISTLWNVRRNFAAGGCKIFFFRRSGIFIRNKPINTYIMTSVHPHCTLFTAPTVRFNAYILKTDYEYAPKSDKPREHIISRYRYENPDPFLARAGVIRKIRMIKDVLELGSDDLDYNYNFQGLHLTLEYQLENLSDNQPTVVKKFRILDGNATTNDTILSRLETEAVLLDTMGFHFFRYVVEGGDGREYSVVGDEIDGGMTELL
jgi:hypothetical protein